ncbi:MAG: GNAT family N-acetyltransferase [Anaerolineae bacterium]|nr:GNAT family N-acetyltransferase [Anaerolineae bacterium]MCB0255659.1 GNAT family N-acetyltransferase [Anaerolineae bacterium]
MKTTHRNYDDEVGDFNLISRFILENNSQIRKHSTWCIGRFVDWKYALWGDKLSTPGFHTQNAHLWLDGFGYLAGFAISENGGHEIAIVTAEGYRFLFEEMLVWAIENWGDRGPGLSIEITSQQLMEVGFLERNGFRREASFFRAHFDLTKELVDRYQLDDGFTIVAMKTDEDYRAQLLLRQNAFAGKTAMSDEEIEHIANISSYGRDNPIYHSGTDLCVVAPNGRYVSGCEALIDTRNLEADIERVCTHSDYRRQGLARVAIQACLYRLKAIGVKQAHITGYSEGAIALYSSLGAGKRTEYWIYQHQS